MDKKELIDEIAKKHHIILDEADPILAVISANEMIFDEYINKVDNLFIKHKADLESFKINISRELKEYIETNKEILRTIAAQNLKFSESKQEKTEQPEGPKEEKYQISKNHIFIFMISQIILLLMGLLIGILI
jgi:hypothetical protein